MTEPKMWFDNDQEMLDTMEEWKNILGLSDWKIAGRICTADEMDLKDVAGESDSQFVNKVGLISIRRKEDMPIDGLLKQPHEEVLIHELLHFRFISFEAQSREDTVFELMQHQLLQDIARALFMVKYGLNADWFIAESHKCKQQ